MHKSLLQRFSCKVESKKFLGVEPALLIEILISSEEAVMLS